MKPLPVFLDRDGVINRNRQDYVRSIDQWEPLPGSIRAMAKLSVLGFPVVVITNQSAIGRGYCTENDVLQIHAMLRELVEDQGGTIDAIYFCPHRPDDGCDCRKPETGMIERARNELNLPPGGYIVGDAASDIKLGVRAGLRTVLVLTGRGRDQMRNILGQMEPSFVADDLQEAVEWIIRDSDDVQESMGKGS
jgi:D-glycero-D-manno-heptose 1,7-bisphosphate phosphatase